MKVYRLKEEQFLPISLDEAWEFFSSPMNLNEITPDEMNFQTISGADEKAFQGQIIRYKIKPFLNIPMNWVTEIKHLSERHYFVDEQRFGPYKFWHHLHRFKEVEGGVMMEDILHYALPMGLLGEIFGGGFVAKKVNGIFSYRREKLDQIFKAQ